MDKHSVRDPGMALAYITDCTLATVCDLASKKSRKKYEYERQISIAQRALDWMKCMDVDYSKTRGAQVDLHRGSVAAWAKTFESNPTPTTQQP